MSTSTLSTGVNGRAGEILQESCTGLQNCSEDIFAGELDAVEEEAGTVHVYLVGSKFVDHLEKRVLERRAVFGQKDGEAAPGVPGYGWLAAGMMVVAVSFCAQSG
jgi:hypothetical protein